MAQTQDYYAALGVGREASEDDLRAAYRRLALKYHPDVNKEADAAERFAEISTAYEVLSDPEKRQAYDRYGAAGVGAASGGGAQEWSTRGGHVPDLSDLFEQMFAGGGSPFGTGGGHHHRSPRRGSDLRHTLTVSFLTAARGGEEEIRLGGSRIAVRIPAGIESGRKLRVEGKGRPGSDGGPAGDLIVTINVGADPWFRRDGLDLLIDVPLSITEATLGCTLTVPLLSGSVELKIPAGAASGQKLRVKGQGIQASKGPPGDFHAVVQIVPPRTLGPKATELMEALAVELQNPRESAPWADSG